MSPKVNLAELDKCRDIAFAAIEYDIKKQEGLVLPPAQLEYYKKFHQIWREQIEKQYGEKELAKLQKLLLNLTMVHKIAGNIDFVKYIKEQTGYDYDLFGNIYERIDKIIARKRIANSKERNDVATMIELYRRSGTGQENAALLHNLSMDFHDTQVKKKPSG